MRVRAHATMRRSPYRSQFYLAMPKCTERSMSRPEKPFDRAWWRQDTTSTAVHGAEEGCTTTLS